MRIQNLKVAATATDENGACTEGGRTTPELLLHAGPMDRTAIELAFLNARIRHLELLVETARGLLGNHQEKLLRGLYDVPQEMADLSAQLRQFDRHLAGG